MNMREIMRLVEAAGVKLQDIRERDGFEMWFEGSKIVDDQGNPLRVYHGTTSDFDTFSGEHAAYRGGIIAFFSTSTEFASDYATKNTGANVKACYLRAEKPFDYRNEGERMARYFWEDTGGLSDQREINRILMGLGAGVEDLDEEGHELTEEQFAGAVASGSWDAIEAPEFVEYLHQDGYDAIVLLENGAINFGIFDPKQVKSAFARTFDYDDERFDESTELTEGRVHQIRQMSGAPTKVIENPNPAQLKSLFRHDEVKFLISSEGEMFAWDAYDATHDLILHEIGIEPETQGILGEPGPDGVCQLEWNAVGDHDWTVKEVPAFLHAAKGLMLRSPTWEKPGWTLDNR